MKIHIRPYQNSDKEILLSILRLNTPHFFAVEEIADFSHYLDAEIEYYYVIELEGEIVGCGGINFAENQTVGKISWDILHPNFQGLGLGKALLQHRIRVLTSIPNIQKIIVRTSQLAYLFYQKNGFELLEIIENYWAQGFDLYLMEYKSND